MSPTPSPTERPRLAWKTRRRLALLVLILGLPAYVVVATTVVGWFGRPAIWLELLVYVGLGFLWALPLRRLFQGIGQPDPDAGGPGGDGSRGA